MEHLQHFGLVQDPFSNEPDLRFYFDSASHRDAQRRVERGLRQHKGLTLLTGEGGMGKTFLTRRILESLEEEIFEATLLVMLPGATNATGILQRFARQLGAEEPSRDRALLLAQIYEQLAIIREDGRHAVLMIDDAQVMTPEVFAELGGLLNLEYEDRRLVSMLFIGSPELDALVQNDPSMAPRIDVRVQLHPLSSENAAAYIVHRMAAVGADVELVPLPALDALYKFGRGRPRLINTLADNGLFEAYLAGRPCLDPSDVERAAMDLGIGADPGTTFTQGVGGALARPVELEAVPETSSTPAVSAPRSASSSRPLRARPEGQIGADITLEEEADVGWSGDMPDGESSPSSDLDGLSLDSALGSGFDAAIAELEDPIHGDPARGAGRVAPVSVMEDEWDLGDLDLCEQTEMPAPARSTSKSEEKRSAAHSNLEIPDAQAASGFTDDVDELDDVFVELIDE